MRSRKYGASKLFAEVAFEIAIEHDLLSGLMHVDTTSFLVHGDDEKSGSKEETNKVKPTVVDVTYGHSKDYRPDKAKLYCL